MTSTDLPFHGRLRYTELRTTLLFDNGHSIRGHMDQTISRSSIRNNKTIIYKVEYQKSHLQQID